jgi:HK97 family phage major capsid protein
MNDQEFQTKVLGGVEALQAEQKTAKQEIATLSAETKSAIAEIDKVKKVTNDQAILIEKVRKANEMLHYDIARAQGNPIGRIMRDENKAKAVLRALFATFGANASQLSLRPEAKALLESSTPGSTMINAELARDVYDVLGTYGAWSSLGVRSVGTYLQKLPVKTARPVAYWLLTGGGQITPDSTKAGTSVDLNVLDIGVLLAVAKALVEEAELDVVQDILDDFGEACAYRLDWSAFAADGTSDVTDGGFTGIASGGTAATAANGNTTTEKLDLEDFVRCLTTVASGVLGRPCKWWIHPTILAKICLIKDANGRPIFQNALEAPAPNAIGSILGYPVVLTEAMPSTDSAGNVVAVFGDPQGCAVGVRKQFEFAASDSFYFDYNQIAYRGIMRAGVAIRRATAFAKLTLAAA